ncbi:ArsR family transcriptional regulator [Candidatus Saccharibacteria bacterium]|nr:ArsR family transcriptional regulator [Candidatus Saccharibacteria bacterium]
MLKLFITSRVRRKIVMVFSKYPDFKTPIRGLVEILQEDPGNVQRELNRLAKGKFIIITKKGKVRFYQVNKQYPILKELQSITLKSQRGSKPSKTIG